MQIQVEAREALGAGTPTASSFTVGVREDAQAGLDYYIRAPSAMDKVGELTEGYLQGYFEAFFNPSKTIVTETFFSPFNPSEPVRIESSWNNIWKATFRTTEKAKVWHIYVTFREPVDPELIRGLRQARKQQSVKLQSLMEKEAFLKQKGALMMDPKYQGRFVAVLDGKVVDSDPDDQRLAARILKKFGYRPAYLGYVGELEPELFIPPS